MGHLNSTQGSPGLLKDTALGDMPQQEHFDWSCSPRAPPVWCLEQPLMEKSSATFPHSKSYPPLLSLFTQQDSSNLFLILHCQLLTQSYSFSHCCIAQEVCGRTYYAQIKTHTYTTASQSADIHAVFIYLCQRNWFINFFPPLWKKCWLKVSRKILCESENRIQGCSLVKIE